MNKKLFGDEEGEEITILAEDIAEEREFETHDLLLALEQEEGPEREELAELETKEVDEGEEILPAEDGTDYDDGDEEGKKKSKKTNNNNRVKKPRVSTIKIKKESANKRPPPKKLKFTGIPKNREPVLPRPPPRMPESGPEQGSLETDMREWQTWTKKAISILEVALTTQDSIAEIRTHRVIAQYAEALRETGLIMAKFESRMQEMHRTLIGFTYDARRRETFGDKRGSAAFFTVSKQ